MYMRIKQFVFRVPSSEIISIAVTESEVPYNWDISYPGDTYYGFVSIMLNRQATKEEVGQEFTYLAIGLEYISTFLH